MIQIYWGITGWTSHERWESQPTRRMNVKLCPFWRLFPAFTIIGNRKNHMTIICCNVHTTSENDAEKVAKSKRRNTSSANSKLKVIAAFPSLVVHNVPSPFYPPGRQWSRISTLQSCRRVVATTRYNTHLNIKNTTRTSTRSRTSESLPQKTTGTVPDNLLFSIYFPRHHNH